MPAQRDSLQRRFCAALLGLGVLTCSAASGAETTSATEKTGATAAADVASPGSAISGARRELDAIKALRDPSQTPKGALPKIGMPELHTVAPDAQPWSTKQGKKTDANAKESANWLVDAMMKEDRRANGSGPTRDTKSRAERGARRERDGLAGESVEGTERDGLARANEERPSSAGAESREGADSQRQKELRETANPLTQYLGEWLTPRDYALLRPGLEEAAAGGRSANGLDPRIAATLGSSVIASGAVPGVAANEAAAAFEAARQATPRENPYLEAMQPLAIAKPANAAPLPAPTLPQAISQPGGPTGMTPHSPPAVAPSTSKIPDFAKPAQDEKYFKQLKRF